MSGAAAPGREVELDTARLLLRPMRVYDAVVHSELWAERDPRVPPHRRLDADGRPTVADLEESIRARQPSSIGLFAVERKAEGFTETERTQVHPVHGTTLSTTRPL